jgi:hypothetical protein
METNELIQKIDELENILPSDAEEWTNYLCQSFFITTIQFVRIYVGTETEFYKSLDKFSPSTVSGHAIDRAWEAKKVLKSLRDYLQLNLNVQKTEKYNIKIDIISDFLTQAIELANEKRYHPAAAAILMGASLEEFLKKLLEQNVNGVGDLKLTIDPVSRKLYENEIITKQDLKDITSWAGIRNDATHGKFEDVNDRKRIQNAIEGVNLFMRKYQIINERF